MIFEFARADALFDCVVPILGKYRLALRFRSTSAYESTHEPFFSPLMRFAFATCICICVPVHGSDFGLLTFCHWHTLTRLAFWICLVALFSSQSFLMQ